MLELSKRSYQCNTLGVEMKNYTDLLNDIDIIKSMSFQEIESYINEGSFKISQYGKNNIVHFEGEICEKLEIILSGKVVVERIDELGNLMTIAEFFAGDILGGNLLFSKKPFYPMSVTAKDPVLILEINKDRLFNMFSDNHDFLKSYLEYVSDHTVILGDRIKNYVNNTIYKSLTSYFEYEFKKQKSKVIKLNITKKALAERFGVQRTSLSREFAKMRDEGLIEFDSTSVKLLEKFFENIIND